MIFQQKYIGDMLKRFHIEYDKPIDTTIRTSTKLNTDEPDPLVNEMMYHWISGSILYLTASKPNRLISFLVYECV